LLVCDSEFFPPMAAGTHGSRSTGQNRKDLGKAGQNLSLVPCGQGKKLTGVCVGCRSKNTHKITVTKRGSNLFATNKNSLRTAHIRSSSVNGET
jgi:hypothetical protein